MLNKYSDFEPDCFYHIYNRANGNEMLFLSEENYTLFLKRYTKYLSDLVDTYCYCLMPNHFHFLIKIKNEQLLKALPKFGTLAELQYGLVISKQFSNFFSSYTQAFNKMHSRKGTLFMKPFKRIKVEDESYMRKLVHYIHCNPIEAGLAVLPENWKFSSYRAIISDKPTLVSRDNVLAIFDDKQNFIYCHQASPSISGIEFY